MKTSALLIALAALTAGAQPSTNLMLHLDSYTPNAFAIEGVPVAQLDFTVSNAPSGAVLLFSPTANGTNWNEYFSFSTSTNNNGVFSFATYVAMSQPMGYFRLVNTNQP